MTHESTTDASESLAGSVFNPVTGEFVQFTTDGGPDLVTYESPVTEALAERLLRDHAATTD